MEQTMIKIGLIGYGYWGPNLARNFSQHPEVELCSICDASSKRLEVAALLYPQVRLVNNVKDFLANPSLDAVAIATPVATHYELARKVLQGGRHLWLEKPMTERVDQAESLIELSKAKNKVLMVDHTFVYTGAVRKIKEIIDQGELGDLIYYDSTRANLGLFQQDVDVIWDLAPHDISIIDYLFPMRKLSVCATGTPFFRGRIVPKALLTMYLADNIIAHVNVSWVSPVKIRNTFIAGTSKMIYYDDTHPSEKVKVYDKGVNVYQTKEDLDRLMVQYRVGDMYAPKLEDHEALALETGHFVACIKKGEEPITNGEAGLEVVKILVASKKSLDSNGLPVDIS